MLTRPAAAVVAVAIALSAASCGSHTHPKVIVIGVDGMDPGFVERHWNVLPNLARLRAQGEFSRLATTTPPQSPVAWSTFATGLDPGDHGIFDFVHRDPRTREPFLSTARTVEPRFRLSFGPWQIPLERSRVESLRKGKVFWQTLQENGVPVTVVRMPVNYPPLPFGREIAGMGTPDLRGTQSTFTYFTDAPGETSRAVAGGLIRKVELGNGSVVLHLEGPPNSLRRDRAYSAISVTVDIDPELPVARIEIDGRPVVLQQGEWSDWLMADFPLIPHIASVRGMFRVYAKQLHPGFEIYISPVNVDPEKPALPVSWPESFARALVADSGRFPTVGIAEDTSALRQGVLTLPEFLVQSRQVLDAERRLLRATLGQYRDGFLFYYFSSVDQNSHILWGRHDPDLLEFYRAVDDSIGEVARRVPDATIIVMSDHGFSSLDRAVNLNSWLLAQGLLTRGDQARTKAYAMGLNSLYLTGADRDDLRRRLLDLRDPENGRAVVEAVSPVEASPANRGVAPDLIVGYAPGYRASWATGLGEVPDAVFETNTDAWIADHCIAAADVPGVLIANRALGETDPSLKTLSRTILKLFGLAP